MHIHMSQNTIFSALSLETGAAEQIASSGILPTLAQTLRQKGSLTTQVTLLVAEMAREGNRNSYRHSLLLINNTFSTLACYP